MEATNFGSMGHEVWAGTHMKHKFEFTRSQDMIVLTAQIWLAVVASGSTLPGKLLTRFQVRSHIWDHFDQHNTGAIASSHGPRGASVGVWKTLHVIFLLKASPYSNIELKKRYLSLNVCDLHQLMLLETVCTMTCASGSVGMPGKTWKLH